ncbi:glucose-6-phosphate dehydrogenase [Streptomyces sp. NPDC101181]|uniref:glucose-6-phosphate dehydrogenase n=1 Tax=Streptomyces sp. NPDC101181 TaxID=3366125 RepID=UPI0038185D4D
MTTPRASGEPPVLLVLFGATGDLAGRMIFPALLELRRRGLLPADFAVIGSGRHAPASQEDFRGQVRDALTGDGDPSSLARFTERVEFAQATAEDGTELAAAVRSRREELGADCRTFVYFSVPPEHLGDMVRMTDREGIADGATLMVEKPLGVDVPSARGLNALLASVAPPERVLRVDHFLAKESLRALLALRTGNTWASAVWDAGHIASVGIDVPETIGIEGRASFMESTGTFRDMVPTHLFQVLAVAAMEPPEGDDAEAEREARLRLFQQTRPLDPAEAVLGQYEGYRDEEGVADDSTTETFAAVRVHIDNDRWRGVPFVLSTGKALDSDDARVTVRFHEPLGHRRPPGRTGTELVVGLGAGADIRLGTRLTAPGPGPRRPDGELRLAPHSGDAPLSAYAAVFLHAFAADHRVFTTAAETERVWELVAPVQEHPPRPQAYPRGSRGPEAATGLGGHPEAGA